MIAGWKMTITPWGKRGNGRAGNNYHPLMKGGSPGGESTNVGRKPKVVGRKPGIVGWETPLVTARDAGTCQQRRRHHLRDGATRYGVRLSASTYLRFSNVPIKSTLSEPELSLGSTSYIRRNRRPLFSAVNECSLPITKGWKSLGLPVSIRPIRQPRL